MEPYYRNSLRISDDFMENELELREDTLPFIVKKGVDTGDLKIELKDCGSKIHKIFFGDSEGEGGLLCYMSVLSNLLRAINALQHEFDTVEEKMTEKSGVSPVKENIREKMTEMKLDLEECELYHTALKQSMQKTKTNETTTRQCLLNFKTLANILKVKIEIFEKKHNLNLKTDDVNMLTVEEIRKSALTWYDDERIELEESLKNNTNLPLDSDFIVNSIGGKLIEFNSPPPAETYLPSNGNGALNATITIDEALSEVSSHHNMNDILNAQKANMDLHLSTHLVNDLTEKLRQSLPNSVMSEKENDEVFENDENIGENDMDLGLLADKLMESNQHIKGVDSYYQHDNDAMSLQSLRIEKITNQLMSPQIPASCSKIIKKKRRKKKNKAKRNLFQEKRNPFQEKRNLCNKSEVLVNRLASELNKKNKHINFNSPGKFNGFTSPPSESAYSVADSVAALTRHLQEANQDVQGGMSEGRPARSEAAFSVADSVADITSQLSAINSLKPDQFQRGAFSPSENSHYAESVYTESIYADSVCSYADSLYDGQSSCYGSPRSSMSGASVGPRKKRSRRKKLRKHKKNKRRKRKEKIFTLFEKIPVFRGKKLTKVLLPPAVKTFQTDPFFDPLV